MFIFLFAVQADRKTCLPVCILFAYGKRGNVFQCNNGVDNLAPTFCRKHNAVVVNAFHCADVNFAKNVFQCNSLVLIRQQNFLFHKSFLLFLLQEGYLHFTLVQIDKVPKDKRNCNYSRQCKAKPRHGYLSLRQAIPGKTFPSNNSRLAPPPVLTCVILSA